MLFLVISWTLPVGLAVLLACLRQWMWAAVAVAAFSVPHQLMGLTSTCTQGADSSFGSGAITSGPLLVIAIGMALWALHGRKVDLTASVVVLAVPLILMILTHSAWINTLRYGTPCGEDFVFYGSSSPAMISLIVVGYLVLPVFLAVTAAASSVMAWRLTADTR